MVCLKRQDELLQNSLKISDQITVGWSFFLMRKGKKKPVGCVCVCVCCLMNALYVKMTHCEAELARSEHRGLPKSWEMLKELMGQLSEF